MQEKKIEFKTNSIFSGDNINHVFKNYSNSKSFSPCDEVPLAWFSSGLQKCLGFLMQALKQFNSLMSRAV